MCVDILAITSRQINLSQGRRLYILGGNIMGRAASKNLCSSASILYLILTEQVSVLVLRKCIVKPGAYPSR